MKWRFTCQPRVLPNTCLQRRRAIPAFMDRSIRERPHSVPEDGLGLCGRQQRRICHIRAEYPCRAAPAAGIAQMEDRKFLGDKHPRLGFSFRINIREGGAFVWGKRPPSSPVSRKRPAAAASPYPAQEGLWGKPQSSITWRPWNNVARIFGLGPEVYKNCGTERAGD